MKSYGISIPFITTGIGSFPHKDEKKIFHLILEKLPSYPLLAPNAKTVLFGSMVLQYSEDFLL